MSVQTKQLFWRMFCTNTSLNSPRSIRVVLGDLILFSTHNTEQYRDVYNVYVHPDWNNHSISSGWVCLLLLSCVCPIDIHYLHNLG